MLLLQQYVTCTHTRIPADCWEALSYKKCVSLPVIKSPLQSELLQIFFVKVFTVLVRVLIIICTFQNVMVIFMVLK